MTEAGIRHETGVSQGRRIRLAALIVLLSLTVAACGGGGSKKASSKSTTSSTGAPTTSTTTLESKIFADLDAYNAMYRRALEDPNPSNPELNSHMTGPTIAQFRTFLLQLQQAHKSLRGPYKNSYRMVSLDGASAVVHECTDDQAHWYQDGRQLPDEPGDFGRIGYEIKVVLDAGTWKVFTGTKKASAC